jgi:predicted transcriptional regulator
MMLDLSIFFSDKQVLVLENCDGKYFTDVAKLCDVTFAHVHNVISLFERKGILKSEKQGRRKFIKLTKKGKDLLSHYKSIRRLMQ